MKKLVVKNPESCKACLTCMQVCAKSYYKTEDISMSMLNIGGNAVQIQFDLCTQCGLCAKACPMDAISQNKFGVYTVDRKACVGCLACMDICPQNVIRKSHDNPYVTKCIACGICVKACPEDVLAIENV